MDAPVLKDVSFRLEGGQTLALVGATGSGKSTALRLLFRSGSPLTAVQPNRPGQEWEDWSGSIDPKLRAVEHMVIVPERFLRMLLRLQLLAVAELSRQSC